MVQMLRDQRQGELLDGGRISETRYARGSGNQLVKHPCSLWRPAGLLYWTQWILGFQAGYYQSSGHHPGGTAFGSNCQHPPWADIDRHVSKDREHRGVN